MTFLETLASVFTWFLNYPLGPWLPISLIVILMLFWFLALVGSFIEAAVDGVSWALGIFWIAFFPVMLIAVTAVTWIASTFPPLTWIPR